MNNTLYGVLCAKVTCSNIPVDAGAVEHGTFLFTTAVLGFVDAVVLRDGTHRKMLW